MTSSDTTVPPSPIIWTPRFIILFASLLALGLSAASILTQAWDNTVLNTPSILLFYTGCALASSLLLTFKTQNPWIRAGGIMACLWCLLMGLHFAIPTVSDLDLDPQHAAIIAHLDIATQCAFLGVATCFFISSTPFKRWDFWFFCLLPIVGTAIVEFNVLLAPTDLATGNFSESMIVTALLYLSVIIWWCRPANWRVQPGVTFLAGTIPWLQILFMGSGYHANDIAFFITQVLLLLFSLLNLRLLQAEQRLFT